MPRQPRIQVRSLRAAMFLRTGALITPDLHTFVSSFGSLNTSKPKPRDNTLSLGNYTLNYRYNTFFQTHRRRCLTSEIGERQKTLAWFPSPCYCLHPIHLRDNWKPIPLLAAGVLGKHCSDLICIIQVLLMVYYVKSASKMKPRLSGCRIDLLSLLLNHPPASLENNKTLILSTGSLEDLCCKLICCSWCKNDICSFCYGRIIGGITLFAYSYASLKFISVLSRLIYHSRFAVIFPMALVVSETGRIPPFFEAGYTPS
ncbi:uncharacterized protein BDR25DRAFT_353081 [Lindgomyces ingoldianus]|uniref:Uncharacterized protein n=1 Tax=Lindgomyces ingoldianus TaxID=673940 RepID=A0ACB6R132_9PLEO|nr:uncharacterized protein BDR25DRAFT_353081 [Lindgomyces ingoldianus]KAF2472757.1 hypothetical protein BDR25DRAFT_353081 [Lindgomyces ingoldianus]